MNEPEAGSVASDPGGMELSERKLAALQPELASERAFAEALARDRRLYALQERERWRRMLADHLRCGDTQPAVVVALRPPVVAAYSEDLDAVALLAFPDRVATAAGWRAGARLLTVNTYREIDGGIAPDLVLGPEQTGSWGNFHPLVADLLTDDRGALEAHREDVDEEAWARCETLGREALGRKVPPRDGSPIWSGSPAGDPGYWWGRPPREEVPASRGRGLRIAALAVGLYVALMTTFIGMEGLSRWRFTVPTKADVAAAPPGPERLRLERARLRVLDRRAAWVPYAACEIARNGLSIVVIVAGLGAFPLLWRQGWRNPERIVVGGMVLWLLPALLVTLPPELWVSHLEQMRSPPERLTAALEDEPLRRRGGALDPAAAATRRSGQ